MDFFFLKKAPTSPKSIYWIFWDTICNGWDWEECVHFNTGFKKVLQGERHRGVDVLESFALLFPWHLSEGVCKLGQNGWGGRREVAGVRDSHVKSPTVPEQQQHLESIESFSLFFGYSCFLDPTFETPASRPAGPENITLWGFVEEGSWYSVTRQNLIVVDMRVRGTAVSVFSNFLFWSSSVVLSVSCVLPAPHGL